MGWTRIFLILLITCSICRSKAISPTTSYSITKIDANLDGHPCKPCRSVVSFVNGIYHSVTELQAIAQQLEEIFSEEVRVFYNPSTGNWFSDAYRAGVELIYKPDDLVIAKRLAEHLRRALKDVGKDGRVLHLAHSGGAIMTYLAARYHLTTNETSRIDIATFGGGRSITRKYFGGGRIVNYYSQNDPLLMVDKRASLLSKMLNASTSRSVINGAQIATYNEIRDMKHNTTFVFLDGQLNHPIRDHGMEGPTYLLALQLEALEHKRRMSQLSTPIETRKYYMRLGRKRIAKITGIRHFWGSVPHTVRSFRKRSARITNIHNFFNATMPAVSFFKNSPIMSIEVGLHMIESEQVPMISESMVDNVDVHSADYHLKALANYAIKGLNNLFNATIPAISSQKEKSSRIFTDHGLDANRTEEVPLIGESVVDDVESAGSLIKTAANYAIKGLNNLFNVTIPAISSQKKELSRVCDVQAFDKNRSEPMSPVIESMVDDVHVDVDSAGYRLEALADYAFKAFNITFAD